MSTARRPLGHGPQHQAPAAPQSGSSGARRLSAAEADVETSPLSSSGQLYDLAQYLRERGVLAPPGGSSDRQGDGPARD